MKKILIGSALSFAGMCHAAVITPTFSTQVYYANDLVTETISIDGDLVTRVTTRKYKFPSPVGTLPCTSISIGRLKDGQVNVENALVHNPSFADIHTCAYNEDMKAYGLTVAQDGLILKTPYGSAALEPTTANNP